MKTVGQPIRKKDAYALVTGKPVFTDDIAPKDCLVVKVLRSPHANAMVKNIRTDLAERWKGSKLFIHGKTCRRSVLPWLDRPIPRPVPMTG